MVLIIAELLGACHFGTPHPFQETPDRWAGFTSSGYLDGFQAERIAHLVWAEEPANLKQEGPLCQKVCKMAVLRKARGS